MTTQENITYDAGREKECLEARFLRNYEEIKKIVGGTFNAGNLASDMFKNGSLIVSDIAQRIPVNPQSVARVHLANRICDHFGWRTDADRQKGFQIADLIMVEGPVVTDSSVISVFVKETRSLKGRMLEALALKGVDCELPAGTTAQPSLSAGSVHPSPGGMA